MKTSEVLKLIANALELNDEDITLASDRDNVDDWDSIGHLNILTDLDDLTDGMAVEMDELNEAFSVQDIVNVLTSKGFISK